MQLSHAMMPACSPRYSSVYDGESCVKVEQSVVDTVSRIWFLFACLLVFFSIVWFDCSF